MKKIKRKIVFLILHYNTLDDTEKCIDSIKKYVKKEYHIVIVDNFSQNKSGNELKKKYSDDETITVLFNKKNDGFARGNNLGFKYIKEYFQTDFIAMINNDTMLLHDDFLDLVEDEYKKSGFAVLGPKILLPNNKVNPIQKSMITKEELIKRMKRMKIMYYCNLFYMQFLYDLLKKVYLTVIHKKIMSNYTQDGVNKRCKGIVLHGSFLIFSKEYISLFDGLDSRTYMYMEEKLLALRIKKYELVSVYNPKIEIFHNEDSATNSVKKSKRSKNLFLYKNAYNSAKILLNELEKMGD